MNGNIFFACAKGEGAGEVSLGIPVQFITGLIIENKDQPSFHLIFRKTALADARSARIFHEEIDAPKIIPDIVKKLLQVLDLFFHKTIRNEEGPGASGPGA
jgi:hypothetical protein